MKLKSYTFFWVALASILPVTILGFIASFMVQTRYYDTVNEDIQHTLSSITLEVGRSLQNDRRLVHKLTEAPAMQRFLPVLAQLSQDRLPADYDQQRQRLARFFEDYQSILARFDTLRVLDQYGNTLLKVRSGRESITRYESFLAYPLMEKEVVDEEHQNRLANIADGSIAFVELLQTREELGPNTNVVILDAVTPLMFEGDRVGYLAVTINGDNIDRLLELAPRPYNGNLLIAELNPENPRRDGQILYQESSLLRFTHLKSVSESLYRVNDGRLVNAVSKNPFGTIADESGDGRYYFYEYYPYPNSLASWMFISYIDDKQISSPFDDIRLGVLALSLLTIVISLFLSQFSSLSIAKTVQQLTRHLKEYAEGKPWQPIAGHRISEINEMAASINDMVESIERAQKERSKAENMMLQNAKLASLGQMAAGIGHEINNPLNNIQSLTTLIKMDVQSLSEAEQEQAKKLLLQIQEDINSLDEETTRASTIVQGILSFARHMPDKNETEFELCPLMFNCFNLVNQEAKKQDVRINDDCRPERTFWIKGDRGKLQQALINLLLNAIQASPKGGQVDLAMTHDAESITISISDQGEGISDDVAEKIFDPFFTTKEVGKGTGLGLSISLGIIENHGGQLSLRNRPDGKGAIAQITLPILRIE